MLYVDFKAGEKEYKLRLTTRHLVELEKKIGKNPMNIFKEDELPAILEMVTILHLSLQQFQHGITLDDAFNIFDEYLESGNTMTSFVYVIIEIYKNAGLIDKDLSVGETEKN